MEISHTNIKNAIKWHGQLANMMIITNMTIKITNDARIGIIDSGKKRKPCELQLVFLGASSLATDPIGFWEGPRIDQQRWNGLN